MSSDKLKIREYRRGDEYGILSLQEEYGEKKKALEEWRWKFRNGPCGPSIFGVIEDKGEIVGTQALTPVMLCFGGRNILGAMSEWTLLRSEYRGKGLFKKLYNKCFNIALEKNIKLIWGFTGAVKAFAGYGFSFYTNQKELLIFIDKPEIRPSSLSQVPPYLARYLIYSILKSNQPLLKSNQRNQVDSRFQVLSFDRANQKFDDFWQKWSNKKKFYTIVHSSDYLNWRLFDNPYMTYKILAAVKNDVIYGYIVLGDNYTRWEQKNIKYGTFSNLLVLNGKWRKDVIRTLVHHAFEYFRSKGISMVHYFCLGKTSEIQEYLNPLCKSAISWSTPPIVMKSLVEESLPATIYNFDNWFMTRIFLEDFG